MTAIATAPRQTQALLGTDKEVGTVYVTRDYKKFKFLKRNRKVKEGNLKKLRLSIRKVGQKIPILVDKDGNIKDGQHRFMILQELGMPVKYQVGENISLEDMQEIQTSLGWVNQDYLDLYLQDDDPKVSTPYKLYDQFSKRFKVGHNMTLAFITGRYRNNVDTEGFKKGELKVSQTQFDKAWGEAELLEEFSAYHKKWRKRSFVLAFFNLLLKVKGYNHQKMISKVSRNSKELLEHNKTEHYLQNLLEIYNRYEKFGNRLTYDPNDIITAD